MVKTVCFSTGTDCNNLTFIVASNHKKFFTLLREVRSKWWALFLNAFNLYSEMYHWNQAPSVNLFQCTYFYSFIQLLRHYCCGETVCCSNLETQTKTQDLLVVKNVLSIQEKDSNHSLFSARHYQSQTFTANQCTWNWSLLGCNHAIKCHHLKGEVIWLSIYRGHRACFTRH